MNLHLYKRGNLWYVRLRHGGRERWISTHKSVRREAEAAAADILGNVKRERASMNLSGAIMDMARQMAERSITRNECRTQFAALEREAILQSMKIIEQMIPESATAADELWKRYLLTKPELKESTMESKRQRIGRFCLWADGKDMKKLKEEDARRFLRWIGTEKSQTVNNYISDLSSVWKASPELKNPWTENLRAKSNVEHKKALSVEQVRAIAGYCAKNGMWFWEKAVRIAFYTGLRLKDVVYLSRSDIREDGYLCPTPEKTERNEKKVSIRMTPPLKELLDGIPIAFGSLYYFPDQVKRYELKFGRQSISKEFMDILDKTGVYVPGVGFHSFRHTFVTEAIKAGNSTKDVQAAVGHENLKITEGTYYHGIKHSKLDNYPVL